MTPWEEMGKEEKDELLKSYSALRVKNTHEEACDALTLEYPLSMHVGRAYAHGSRIWGGKGSNLSPQAKFDYKVWTKLNEYQGQSLGFQFLRK